MLEKALNAIKVGSTA